jgi:hypothetical protein
MAQSNEKIVRTYLEAIIRQDFDAALKLLADDVIVHFPGENPFSGDVKGRDELFAQMGRLREKPGTFSQEIHDIATSKEHAVALLTARFERDESIEAWRRVLVFHVLGDTINEAWIFEGDQALVDKLLA